MVKSAVVPFLILSTTLVLNGMESRNEVELPVLVNSTWQSGDSSPRMNHLRKSATNIGSTEERGEGEFRRKLSDGATAQNSPNVKKFVKKILERKNSSPAFFGEPDQSK